MKIAILGATGQVGSLLTSEALARGHTVTGIARDPSPLPKHERLTPAKVDLTDHAQLTKSISGHDVVLIAVKFAALDGRNLLADVKASRAPRLLVVGGAGSLEIAPGKRVVDQPGFPAEYKGEALAAADFLEQLRREQTLDWTLLSPSAYLHPGPRTGKFRFGRDTLLAEPSGESHISIADYAIALLDEVERPQHSRSRFTVGY
jgi:putative NADH-flavin reductase